MRKNKLTSFFTLILVLLIGLVAVVCVIAFKDSSIFLSLFAILVVSSAVISAISTTMQSKKKIIGDRLYNKSLKIKAFTGGYERVPTNSDQSRDDLGPIFDFTDTEEVSEESSLSLDQFLEVNDFKLMPEVIDAIEWKRFELLCHLIFKASGFNSHLTMNGADEGVDIRVLDNNDENRTLYLVQCKKNRKSKVTRPLLQQLRGQMAAENVEEGCYCITSSFTMPAREFAAANNIQLFDQDKITNSFNKLGDIVRKRILKELLEGDYWTPSCASCGEKFSRIKLKNEKIVWGCRNSRKHGWSSIHYYEAEPIKNVH